MFLLILNEQQSSAFLSRPWLSIAVGAAVAGIAALFGGLSPYLLAALTIPLFECTLRYSSHFRAPQVILLGVAVAVFFAHATALAFMQHGYTGAQRFAINIAYAFTILVGAGIGGLMYQNAIRTSSLAANSK